MRIDVKALGDVIVQAVRQHVARAADALGVRIQQLAELVDQERAAAGMRYQQLEDRIAAIPAGKDGAPGERGQDGAAGEPGPPGPQGPAGMNGKDGAAGRDGVNGKDGAPGDPGRDGRDALELEILDGIDPQKSYPRGTVAAYRGGLIKADRRTGAITGQLSEAGWRVILRGVADTAVVPSEDLRTLTIRITHTDGEQLEQVIRSPAIIYREIFREGQDYEPGDAVTFGGSLWIAKAATKSKPGDGSPDWRLACKKGRDGRDAGK